MKNYLMADREFGDWCRCAWKMVREADAMIEKYRLAMELLDAQAMHTILQALKMGEAGREERSDAVGDVRHEIEGGAEWHGGC